MDAKRIIIDAPSSSPSGSSPLRGPWEEPVRSALPAAVPLTDPRLGLSENALVLASQNALPAVAGRKSRRDSLGLAAGGAVALVLGCATFMSLNSGRHAPASSPSRSLTVQNPAQPGLPMAAQMPGKPMMMPPPSFAGPQMPLTAPIAGMAPMPGMTASPGSMPMSHGSPASAPVMVFDGSSAPASTVSAGPNIARGADGAPTLLAGGVPARGGAGDNAAVRATRLSEPASTVVQGTLIAAVLETAIDTDVPGYVRAVVSQDVKSFDGSRVLIPRSSRLIGEYKAATQSGQRRAYLMWTRLVRPDGVSVALASPGADFTGQAGIGGTVNNHFFSRFGSAILLSILGGAGSLVSGGAPTVVVAGAGGNAASSAMQRDDRPPTIKVHQGEPIRVFTARDLIFAEEGAAG